MASRSRAFSKLAKDVDTSGNITTEGIASDVELGGGVTVYASAASLPVSGNTAGDQAFITGTGRLYIFSGVGWYNVALINNTPIIQSVLDSDLGTTPFILANDGTATTITITAVDSDGETITYASSADSDFSGLATISQSSNVFTITPFSQDSATTSSGTITFTATDGINTATSATQTFTLNFLSSLWGETILSIGTSSTNGLDNSTFIDRSTNAQTVTTLGSPIQTAFHPYLENWSVEFDEASRVNMASPLVSATVSTFTVECWVYMTEAPTVNAGTSPVPSGMVTLEGIPGSTTNYNSFGVLPDRTVSLRWYDGSAKAAITSTTLDIGRWYHIACVVNANAIKIYIDGTEDTLTGTTTLTNRNGGTNQSGFGGNYWTDFYGYLSNLRVTHSAVYTTNFTPSSENLTNITNTVLLACQSNRLIDNSSSPIAQTITSNPKVSAFNPFGQGSEYAAGENKGSFRLESGDWVQSPSTSQSSLSYTQDWTIEFWAYMDNDITSVPQLLFNSVEGTGNFYPYIGSNIRAGGQLQTQAVGGEHLTTGYVKPYEWFHVALVHDYSANELKTYLNGELVQTLSKTFTLTSGAIRFNTYTINTASNYPTLGGYLSDFKWTIGSTVYTSNFTPPTAPVNNTNAGLYFPFDNAGIFDKTGINTINPNAVVTQTSDTVYASSTMNFNGSTFIRLESPLHQILGNEDFTLEFHVKINENETRNCIFGIGDHSSNDLSFFCQDNGQYKLHPYGNYSTAYNALWDDNWHHFAISRSSGTLRAFIDGTEVASHASTNNYGTTAQVLNIGYLKNFNGYQFNGYLENFQFFRGLAKYTANFTAPSREQGRTYQAES